MAPLARTLALLAMAVATTAIKVVPLDMAQNSFDDQYLKCRESMSEDLLFVMVPDFCNNDEFFQNWKNATAQWKKQGSVSSPLTKDQAIALMAYTMNETTLYTQFNAAVREAGSSPWKYRNKFRFKSLHFLMTQAVQKLRRPNECQDVFRGVHNYQYKVKKDDKVRFGQFASTSLSKTVAQGFGQDTMFKVHTCYGVDIQKFSRYPSQREVLIPPFETFKVIDVSKEGNTMHIELRSSGSFSNYDCEWLKGHCGQHDQEGHQDPQKNDTTKATKATVATVVTMATVTTLAILTTVATLAPMTTLGIGSTMVTMAIVATVTHEATVATLATMVTVTTEATMAAMATKVTKVTVVTTATVATMVTATKGPSWGSPSDSCPGGSGTKQTGPARAGLELPGQPRTARTAEIGQCLGPVGHFLMEGFGSVTVTATS